MHDADPRPARGRRREFPRLAHLGQEAAARPAILGQLLVAAIAVVSDRGGAHQHPRRRRQASRGMGYPLGAVPARPHDLLLLRHGPAHADQGLARQVHDRVHALQPVVIHFPLCGIPVHGPLSGLLPRAHQAQHAVPAGGENVAQVSPQKARASADGDRERPPLAVTRVQGEVVGQPPMPKREAPFEDALDPPHEGRRVHVQRRAPVDLVLHHAPTLPVRREAMRVHPVVEGAAHLLVPEEHPLLAGRMADRPGNPQRPGANPDGDRAAIGDAALPRHHAHVLPRGKQTLQRTRAHVPREHFRR